MRRRRSGCVARLFALAILALEARAEAAPPVRLHVAAESTCEGSRGLASRLAGRGIVLSDSDADGVDVDVRAMATPGGADAELVIRQGSVTARRSLSAPTCDEVLDALAFTLALALEQPIEQTPPPAAAPAPTPPPPVASPPPPAPAPAPPPSSERAGLTWGGGAGAGVFVGASPSAAAAVVVHAEVESGAAGLVAPSAIAGVMFVLPSTTSASGSEAAFALQMGTLDGCPVRFGGGRLALRPCLEVQAGRLQSRSAGFSGARLASSPWLGLAAALRGRLEIASGIAFELDVAAGSPLIQDVFFVGDQRVFGVGPVLFSGLAGASVHFP